MRTASCTGWCSGRGCGLSMCPLLPPPPAVTADYQPMILAALARIEALLERIAEGDK